MGGCSIKRSKGGGEERGMGGGRDALLGRREENKLD